MLVTDPQNDFLSEEGVAWPLVADSVKQHQTIEHIEQLFRLRRTTGLRSSSRPTTTTPPIALGGLAALVEQMMHETKMFDRRGPLSLDGFVGSGADSGRSATSPLSTTARLS